MASRWVACQRRSFFGRCYRGWHINSRGARGAAAARVARAAAGVAANVPSMIGV